MSTFWPQKLRQNLAAKTAPVFGHENASKFGHKNVSIFWFQWHQILKILAFARGRGDAPKLMREYHSTYLHIESPALRQTFGHKNMIRSWTRKRRQNLCAKAASPSGHEGASSFGREHVSIFDAGDDIFWGVRYAFLDTKTTLVFGHELQIAADSCNEICANFRTRKQTNPERQSR